MSQREKGIVREFHPERGFGFINRRNGRSIFFHIRDLMDPSMAVTAGDELEFSVEWDEERKKPFAGGLLYPRD